MDIREIDPSDTAAITAWYELASVVCKHDIPDFPPLPRKSHMLRLVVPWPHLDESALACYLDGRMVGVASIMMPTRENTNTIYLELNVHPDYRRRGIGSALMDRVFAVARDNQRSLIGCDVVLERPGGPARNGAGAAFVRRFADKPGQVEVRSRWTLGNVSDAEQADVSREVAAHADGYTVRQWYGSTPDDLIENIAALESRFVLDAPTGDLEIEPEDVDPERVRAGEATRDARGQRIYSTVACHDETGVVAAYTVLSFEDGDDGHAWQQITIVDPAHRGHRLGLLVKLANHAFTQANEPALTEIDTWNAEENSFMLAVNEKLGFRPVDNWEQWQVPVT
ncbi:MAG TPA: GNAT family N-acetyltransferase [Micromonosporaceae bacterium]|jgi:GNAT superfamily N-acetyltransferase